MIPFLLSFPSFFLVLVFFSVLLPSFLFIYYLQPCLSNVIPFKSSSCTIPSCTYLRFPPTLIPSLSSNITLLIALLCSRLRLFFLFTLLLSSAVTLSPLSTYSPSFSLFKYHTTSYCFILLCSHSRLFSPLHSPPLLCCHSRSRTPSHHHHHHYRQNHSPI